MIIGFRKQAAAVISIVHVTYENTSTEDRPHIQPTQNSAVNLPVTGEILT